MTAWRFVKLFRPFVDGQLLHGANPFTFTILNVRCDSDEVIFNLIVSQRLNCKLAKQRAVDFFAMSLQ